MSALQRPFQQVDVFTPTPYQGNPLAVVMDGTGLSEAQMLRFANWTNLSETAFLLPPTPEGRAAGADYRVRIFSPIDEMRFAGHPTLGSCHAWLQAGGQPHTAGVVVQECQVGLVRIRRRDSRLFFAAPPLKRSAPSPMLLAQLAAALGLKARDVVAAQMLDNGSPWLGLLLDSPQTVLALEPDHMALKNTGICVGVAGIHAAPADPRLEVRAFAAAVEVPEDPVTGSLNASLAQWLIADGFAPTQYQAAQGTRLNRQGRVHVYQDAGGQVWVGGDSVTCIEGRVLL